MKEIFSRRREQKLPLLLELLFTGLVFYTLLYIAYASGLKTLTILILIGLILIALFKAIDDEDYHLLFYLLFMTPLLLGRIFLPHLGLTTLLTAILIIFYILASNPQIPPYLVDYKIPQEVTPTESAFLLSRDIGPQELISTLFSLYRRGYLNLELSGDRLYFIKNGDYEEDPTLLAYEKFLLDKIFVMTNVNIMLETGILYKAENFPKRVDLELVLRDLDNWADLFKAKLIENLKEEKPILKRFAFETKPFFIALFLTYAISAFIFPKSPTLTVEQLAVSLSFLLLGFKTFLPLTHYGAKVYSKVLGFKDFMKRVEKPRLKYLLDEEKVNLFELLNYLYALNLVTPLSWALEYLRAKEKSEEALLFTKLLQEVWTRWGKGEILGEKEVEY